MKLRIIACAWLAGCADGSPEAVTTCFQAPDGPPIALHGLALGYGHACGLREDGTPVCWGPGDPHHVGGVHRGQASPPADALHGLAATFDGTCGLRADGTVACWGSVLDPPQDVHFSKIALGDGGCGLDLDGGIVCWGSSPPPGRYLDVGVGYRFACALTETKTATCWGEEGPAAPAGTFEHLSIRSTNACALDSAGAIVCWGSDYLGPPPSGAFTSLSVSYGHACAIRNDGALICWGSEADRALTFWDQAPQGTFDEIATGGEFTCARRTDGELVCWGRGENGFPCTVDDSDCGQAIPPREMIEVCAETSLAIAPRVSSGYAHSCRLKDDGRVVCWGAGVTSERCGELECGGGDVCEEIIECGQANPPADATFVRLSAGGTHTCALASDGSVSCWGRNLETLPGGAFAALPESFDHGCGLRPDGRIECWGNSEAGEATPPPGRYREVAPGIDHTCAIRDDGTIVCWGLMIDPDPIPTGTFSNVQSGDDFSCAMTDDRRVQCWGMRSRDTPVPPDVAFTEYDVGDRHACGVREDDGTILCWPDRSADEPLGKTVPPPGAFHSVSAGGDHTCAINADGLVQCWGENRFGQALPPPGT